VTLTIARLTDEHLPGFYEVAKAEEPFAAEMAPTLAHFRATIQGAGGLDGFALMNGDELVGGVTFTAHVPLVDVLIHAVVSKRVRGRWLTREILGTVFGYCFTDLELPRVSAYALPGLNAESEWLLLKMGFRLEGVKECAALLPDGYHDVCLFGMLKGRCPWLTA
jgi:RimJ/RimL family protein N-acetyltransferase